MVRKDSDYVDEVPNKKKGQQMDSKDVKELQMTGSPEMDAGHETGGTGGNVSRRDFLKTSAFAGLGLAALGAKLPTSSYGRATRQRNATSQDLNILMPSSNLPLQQLNTMKSLTQADITKHAWGPFTMGLFEVLQTWKREHPNVKLNITTVNWQDITEHFLLLARSGSAPDLTFINDLNIPSIAQGGFLTPLEELPGDWSDYNQNILRGIASYKNHIYAMPCFTDARFPFYWKENFQQAGISHVPTTWSELEADLVELKKHGLGGYAWWSGNSVHTPTMTIESNVRMLGSDFVDETGKATLVTEPMRETFAFYNRLLNILKVSPNTTTISNENTMLEYIYKRQVTAQLLGSWDWGSLVTDGLADIQSKLGYFKMPRPNASDPYITLSGFWAWEMPKVSGQSKARRDLAFSLAYAIAGPEGQARMLQTDNVDLPTRPSVLKQPFIATKPEFWKFTSSYSLESGHPMPTTPYAAELFHVVTVAFEQYLTGAASLTAALTNAENTFNASVRA